MAKYQRIAIIKKDDNSYEIVNNPKHPIFNEFRANFDHFEIGTLDKELKDTDSILVMLFPDEGLKAVLPDGRIFKG